VRYVALLRGINVGGRTLVKMADLRNCMENLGFEEVSTFIASGNVLFESDAGDDATLATTIEAAIGQRFELPVKVVVLDHHADGRIVEAIPKRWIGDRTLRANVAFVRTGTDPRQLVRELEPYARIEEVKAVDGVILWATRRDSLNRSVDAQAHRRRRLQGTDSPQPQYDPQAAGAPRRVTARARPGATTLRRRTPIETIDHDARTIEVARPPEDVFA
jgi:uncharacterized protein (DUF1697 family)